ncbi:MAG: YbgA family protein [Desulfatiglandales bacterium]
MANGIEKIKIGISACLLGHEVRYDGGHRLDRFLRDTLGQYVEYLPVCPEVECGLGVPREAMRLVGDPNSPRLVTVKTGIDHTDRMLAWAQKRVKELESEGLCGFIFKSKSPSSGMERVKVYGEGGRSQKTGVGLFAKTFMEHFPLIPTEDDGRLHDPILRENFITRIFTLKRWRELEMGERRLGNLVSFHTQHKLLLLSHSQRHYRELGKLVAQGKDMDMERLWGRYETLLMEALRLKATPKKHYNVLLHIMGYFKKELSADEKGELLEVFGAYRDGLVPLIVPITLINHYVRKYNQPYLKEQVYLNPHPLALQLRNHV